MRETAIDMLAAVPRTCPEMDGTPDGPPGSIMKENEQDSKAHWRRQAHRAMQELQALAEEISGAEEILFRLAAEYEAQFALMRLYFRLAEDEPP